MSNRSTQSSEAKLGLLYGLGAYIWWGGAPLYFHLVSHVQPITVLAHRIVWTIVFLLLIIGVQRRWEELKRVLRNQRTMGMLTVASLLIAVNWFVFIYAVSIDQVLQASLGYYINPMVNVLLGLIFLGERFRRWQWGAVALAATGVLYLTLQGGETFPWISLTLAMSFGMYGLIRKKIVVGPVVGLLVESLILLPPTIIVLMMPMGQIGQLTAGTYVLLSLSGIVTAMPLLWFAAGVRRLRLTTMGFVQYLSPTVQFVLAVTLLGEHLRPEQLITFAFIWSAVIVYTIDSVRAHRTPQPVVEIIE